MIRRKQDFYVSPVVDIVELRAQAVLCQSNLLDDMTVDEDGGSIFG